MCQVNIELGGGVADLCGAHCQTIVEGGGNTLVALWCFPFAIHNYPPPGRSFVGSSSSVALRDHQK